MSLFRNLFAKKTVERDLDEEVRAYVDLLADEKIRAGMAPDEARRAARLEAGGIEQIKDDVRDARRGALLDSTMQDLRYGMRILRRSPGFAAIAILTIGLGIGANSAIFSVINGVLRKPLPYPEPHRLMYITSQFPTLGFDKFWVSPPEYFDFSGHTRAFASVGAYTTTAANISEGDRPERVESIFMTASMFDVLKVPPVRGQVFTPEQDRPGGEEVVVIGHELWERAFGADPEVIGRRVQINGIPRTVIGVMPAGFDIHDAKAQLWLPLRLDPGNQQNRGSHYLYLIGRLAQGVSQTQAQAELNGMLRQWRDWIPSGHVPNDSTHRLQLEPLHDEVVGGARNALWVLQGAVLLVLLIAAANVANLLLARAESRHKEFAVRAALGASRARILRQFMSEGVVLSLLGAALGLALAYWGLKAILAANPESIPRAAEVTLDPTVLGVTIAVALATGLIFGLAPLLHMGSQSVTIAIKEGGARSTANAGRARVRRGLVVGEIAIAVMLVIGAGLLIRTFANLTSVDPGFDARNRVTFGLVIPTASYPDSQRTAQFMQDALRRLEQIPGVQRAAAMQGLPPTRPVNANDTDFEHYTPSGPNDPIENVDYYQGATAGYFETMGIQLRDGRFFTAADAAGGPVVIVNEALVRRFYGDVNPIGRRIRPSFGPNSPWFTIVGVVKDVKQGGLDAPAGTELYFNYEQLPRVAGFVPRTMNVVLHSTLPLETIAPAIRRTIGEMDATLPIVRLRTMGDVVGGSLARQRFLSLLLGMFAAVALTLAAIGTYGVLSYMVAERQREIGIRMALGADHARVVRLVLRQGMGIAAVGIGAGIVGAFGLSRLTSSLLYGVSPSDPATFATVAAVIAIVAAAACLVPMRRATRVDPLTAIRAD